MRKKLQKVGTSKALIVTKEMLGMMGVEDGSEVEVQMLGPLMLVRRPDMDPKELEIALAFARVTAEDAEILRRLTE